MSATTGTNTHTTGANGQGNGQQAEATTGARTNTTDAQQQGAQGNTRGQQQDPLNPDQIARIQEMIGTSMNTGIREGLGRIEDSLANILRPILGYDPIPFMPSMGGGFGTPPPPPPPLRRNHHQAQAGASNMAGPSYTDSVLQSTPDFSFGMGNPNMDPNPNTAGSRRQVPFTYPNNIPLGGYGQQRGQGEHTTYPFVPEQTGHTSRHTNARTGGNGGPPPPLYEALNAQQGGYGDPFNRYQEGPRVVDPDVLADTLRTHFGMNVRPMARPTYRKPYPDYVTNGHPLPRGCRIPDFHPFSGEDGASTIEHISRFTAQLGELSLNPYYKMQLFSLSLTRSAFSWFANLEPGIFHTWEEMEAAFHSRFYNPIPAVSLADLLEARQGPGEPASKFIERIRHLKSRCPTTIEETALTDLVVKNLLPKLRDRLTALDITDLSQLAIKASRVEALFRDREAEQPKRSRYHHVASVEVDDEIEMAERDSNTAEQMVAELRKGGPYVCPKLNKIQSKGKESNANNNGEPSFDASKANEIFDALLKDGQITIPSGQKVATPAEIKGRPYCKWHNTFTHTTSQCYHFKKEIIKAIKSGRLKYQNMGIDNEPFPQLMVATISAVPSGQQSTDRANDPNRPVHRDDRPRQSYNTHHPSGRDDQRRRPNRRAMARPRPKPAPIRQQPYPRRLPGRIAEGWAHPDGTYEVEIRDGAVVMERATRKPLARQIHENRWAINTPPPPPAQDSRFPGMTRTQIRRAKRRYAASNRGQDETSIGRNTPLQRTDDPNFRPYAASTSHPPNQANHVEQKRSRVTPGGDFPKHTPGGDFTELTPGGRAIPTGDDVKITSTKDVPLPSLGKGNTYVCIHCKGLNVVDITKEAMATSAITFGNFTPGEVHTMTQPSMTKVEDIPPQHALKDVRPENQEGKHEDDVGSGDKDASDEDLREFRVILGLTPDGKIPPEEDPDPMIEDTNVTVPIRVVNTYTNEWEGNNNGHDEAEWATITTYSNGRGEPIWATMSSYSNEEPVWAMMSNQDETPSMIRTGRDEPQWAVMTINEGTDDEETWASLVGYLHIDTDEPVWATLSSNGHRGDVSTGSNHTIPVERRREVTKTFDPIPAQAPAHLKPLFVKAHVNGKEMDRVFVDNGAVFNIMPLRTLRKLGRSVEDLSEADIQMSSFTGQPTQPLGCIVAQIEVGPQSLSTMFFVIDESPSYNILLGRDWIHSSKCVPSSWHQQLMFWDDDGEVHTMDAAPNPFKDTSDFHEATFYISDIPPISQSVSKINHPWQKCRLTRQGYLFC